MCFLTVSTGDKYDSCMSLERLQLTAAELKNFADQVKQGKNPVCTQHNKHHKPFCKIIVSPALIADHWSLFVDRWSLAGRHLIKNIYSFALTFLKEMLVETSWHGFWLCLTSVTYICDFFSMWVIVYGHPSLSLYLQYAQQHFHFLHWCSYKEPEWREIFHSHLHKDLLMFTR